MARSGPKPPVDGDALEFAIDCARLMNARPVEDAGVGLPFDDIPNDELRALAARYYRRTFDSKADEHWMHAGRIPASQLSGLARLQRLLRGEVVRRMDHPAGFMIDEHRPTNEGARPAWLASTDVAVQVVEGMLQTKLRNGRDSVVAPTAAPWTVSRVEPAPAATRPAQRERAMLKALCAKGAILSVPRVLIPPDPLPPLFGPHALRSSEPALAVLWLLTSARYWPFARCERCKALFVPAKRAQRYCTPRCRRAHDYSSRMLAPTSEAAQRRRSAVKTATDHTRAKRLGTWRRVRAPGAGRPRKAEG